MQVTVQLSPEAARLVRERAAGDPVSGELARAARRHGGELHPLFPDTDDPLLGSFFLVEVPDQGAAERVIEDLKKFPATEAAYIKPADQPP